MMLKHGIDFNGLYGNLISKQSSILEYTNIFFSLNLLENKTFVNDFKFTLSVQLCSCEVFKAVVRQPSGSHQEVVWQLSGSHKIVIVMLFVQPMGLKAFPVLFTIMHLQFPLHFLLLQ